MSPHEECPYQDGRVVIDPAFKADAPRPVRPAAGAGPIHPAEFHPALLKDATPAAGYVLSKPSVGLGAQMMEADPPEHTRLRRLASAAFIPRRTAELAPPPAGEAHLVEAFNAPLPGTVIAELLGIPEEHHRSGWPRPSTARRWPVCTGYWPTSSRTNAAGRRTIYCRPWSPYATGRTAG
ncbi:hypothetical protein [Streptomyces sp. 4N124]|uniref:hypothetical protein n=1 Tax=Streptomyces sp. 4N124 TaxID=3457420 RepID=UPI003FD18559